MIYLIIALAVATRFIPHMPNMVPVTALAIFSAVYLPKKQAIAVSLLVRLISDAIIGFFSWPLMLAVYGSHLFGVLVGWWIKNSESRGAVRWVKVFLSGFLSAGVFYLVTNLVVLYPGMYPQNIEGQLASYVNALPFLRGTLIADVGYTLALFGSYEFAIYISKQEWRERVRRIFANSVA